MRSEFHLSLGVKSLECSIDFFVTVMEAKVTHRDPSGYVNLDLFGNQITLKHNPAITINLPDFHFGINLDLPDFNRLANNILKTHQCYVTKAPEIWDENTPLEHKKMYLKCPTGYLIELKGYRTKTTT